MFNCFTRKYHYFAIYEIAKITEYTLNPKVLKQIKWFFFLRGYKINYCEPLIGQERNVLVLGTVKGTSPSVNRNCFIFLLELFASIKTPSLKVSESFEKEEKVIKGQKIIFYKVNKNQKF